MDNSILLNGDASTLAKHLQASAARLGKNQVTKDLLARVENESLPPRVFTLWLAAGGDCEAIRQGLHFQNSQAVRRASITHFGRLFRTKRLNDVWNSIGGTAQIVGYLAAASVCDVRQFCNEIRRSATTETAAESRTGLVDELYQALRHTDTSETALKTPDRRPLSSIYHSIFPACSQDLILSAVDGESTIDAGHGEPAFYAHTALFRSRCLLELEDTSREVDVQKVLALIGIGSNDSATLQDDSVTANTQFALEVLEVLSIRKKIKGDSRIALREIATPIFRRLARRKCRPETMLRAALAYVAFAQQHISNRLSIKDLYSGAGSFLIKNWGRCPDLLEESLVVYLRLAPSSHLPVPGDLLNLVKLVPRPTRLRLLNMFTRWDLETSTGVEQSHLQWDSHLLLALPRNKARQILERLIALGSKNLNQYHAADRRQEENTRLKIKLSVDQPNLLELATAAVEERKKEASRAREQSHRATCVSSAIHTAATSQHLDLYRETLLWTRKFIKDPLTAMEIFSGTYLNSGESIGLLCGLPSTAQDYSSTTRDQIASRVQKANTIITECFQTACQAQREPGFASFHWNSVLGLMGMVVRQRYQRVNLMQDTLKLSNDDVFEVVWRDTLESCKALEVLGLDDENVSLEFNTLGGPLMRDGAVLPVLTEPRPATLRFLDTLAKDRNGIWEDHRRRNAPATLALDEPYPQGLPLDCLLAVDLKECKAGTQLPYVFSRAEKIVFVPGEKALSPQPVFDDDDNATGTFVENWHHGLRTYLDLSHDRQEAAITAWKHAIGPLSESRMSAAEAYQFWSPLFQESAEHVELYGPWKQPPAQPPAPEIPSVDDVQQSTEWSPGTSVKSFEVKSRRMDPVVIDAMLHIGGWRVNETINSSPWQATTSEVPARSVEPFWSRWRVPRGASSTMREALIAAALLHTSETNSLSPGVLSKPYPSTESARFPALYLDGDFLEREDPTKRNSFFVWGPLMRLSVNVPATLLLHLTKSLIEAPTSSKDRTPTDALKLLRVLIKGDRPQVALDLIQELILERPDDSAWQRLMLTEGLLKSLPKQIAEQFLRNLSSAMQKRLSEQTSSKDSIPSAQTAPRIKITTVKMLSQLLSGAKFVDATFASSVLIDLLASNRHIDVRVSVVESLVEILASSQDAKLCEQIFEALGTYCIPVMSSINEREPISREEWMSIDSTNLPELYDEPGDLPPMLSCMVNSVSRVNESVRKQLFDRILIPTLRKNSETNARWMSLFLQSHEISHPDEPLPNAPAHMQFLVDLMKWPAYIPAWVLDLWLQIMTTLLNPPPSVVSMNTKISEDDRLRETGNGQRWRDIWGPSGRMILLHRTKPASMLSQEWRSFRHDGIDIQQIQEAVLQQASLILEFLGPRTENGFWLAFTHDIKPPSWSSDTLGLWHSNTKPVVQQIVEKVGALRTEEWQRNPDRSPFALPDTFLLRLWLLTPALDAEASRGHDISLFAASASSLLAELVSSNRAYMKKYEVLMSFVLANGTSTDKINLALAFGDLEGTDRERLSAVHDLRVDLARQLLQSTKRSPPGIELQRKVWAMVRNLGSCVDEALRDVGFTLMLDLDSRSVNKAWYAGDADA